MPEAVAAWVAPGDHSIIERINAVQKIHADLIHGYQRDFGKYAGKVDAQLIEAVFRNIPSQLSAVPDGSVKRFQFKGVAERKSRYAEFASPIHWLHQCRLALLNYPVEGQAKAPLAAYQKDNQVKLFLFDVGLLNHMLNTGYREIKQQGYAYKGYIAENFVQQELAVQGIEPSHSWADARAEIEFIITTDEGQVVPIEVKSGKRTRAKSLQSHIEKCAPQKTIKLTGTQGPGPDEQTHMVMPLYYVEYVMGRVN